MTRTEERQNTYACTSITDAGIKERLENLWNNPDSPVEPEFNLAAISNSEVRIGVHVYVTISYIGRTYTCYFAWRKTGEDRLDGAMHLHPEDKYLWSTNVQYKDGFKDTVSELPLPVVEALTYEVAKQLATKCAYNA